jgi:hypothetical protein
MLLYLIVLLTICLSQVIGAEVCTPACGADKVCSFGRCIGKDWPSFSRRYEGRIKVQNNLEPIFDSSKGAIDNILRGGPDLRWLHLHRGLLFFFLGEIFVVLRRLCTYIDILMYFIMNRIS